MYDLGKLGKWSKTTLLDNSKLTYHFMEDDKLRCDMVQHLYHSLHRDIDVDKRIWRMTVIKLYSYFKDIKYNEELKNDWLEYCDLMMKLQKEMENR